MGMVRAKEDCYLGPEHGGFKEKDEQFNYEGPDHDSLEAIHKDENVYTPFSRDELKDELTMRGIRFYESSTDDAFRRQLLDNDNAPKPKETKKKDVI